MRTLHQLNSDIFGSARSYTVYWVSALGSILLSLWTAYHNELINPDGICYLESANVFMHSGVSAATKLCSQARWPVYSILIGLGSFIAPNSLEAVAYVINGIFSLISVVAFIAIVSRLTENRKIIWLAALSILIAHDFNQLREYIIRDHGYWAMSLVAVLCFINYLHSFTWRDALLWAVTSLLATLFRVEGILFFALIPCTVFCYRNISFAQRIQAWLRLNVLPIAALLLLGVAYLFHLSLSERIITTFATRLGEVWLQITHGIPLFFAATTDGVNQLKDYVFFNKGGLDYRISYWLAVSVWYGGNIIASIGIFYAALLIYFWHKRSLKFNSTSLLAVIAYIGVNIFITVVFFVEGLYLSKRYIMDLALLLMLFVPFALYELMTLQDLTQLKRRLILGLTLGLLLLTFVGGVINFGHSKTYIKTAGQWAAANVPASAKIYSNDIVLAYYSGHYGSAIYTAIDESEKTKTVILQRGKEYDYLLLRFVKHRGLSEQEAVHLIGKYPIMTFTNKRNDKVAIFKVSDSNG